MREINEIIIHCSNSEWGNVVEIDRWHKKRGWDGVGYHAIILNGYPEFKDFTKKDGYMPRRDGAIEHGREFETIGAHCLGHNQTSIGICLIGKTHFTSEQLFVTLPAVLLNLFEKLGLSPARMFGHYEFSQNKSCPNINMVQYRKYMQALWIEQITNLELKER